MATSLSTVWELRTTGNDSNGGGFVAGASGTDFSQQDAAQYTFTNLVVDAVTNTKVTSASHNFVAADVGNIMQITAGAGWTTGFYQIVSVAANAATLDRSPAAVGTTGGTFAVGGALLTFAQVIVALPTAGAVNGVTQTVYVKSGTYTLTSTVTFGSNCDADVIGYTTTRTDKGKPTVTTATNSINLFNLNNLNRIRFFNFTFTNTAGTRAIGLQSVSNQSNYLYLENCTIDGMSVGLDVVTSSNQMREFVVVNTEIKNSTSHGVRLGAFSYNMMAGCYIHDNGGDGINISGGNSNEASLTLLFCILKSNTSSGLRHAYDATLANQLILTASHCAFINNTVDGITLTGIGNLYGKAVNLFDCIIDSNSQFGIKATVTGSLIAPAAYVGFNNAFWNNTSGDRSGFPALTGDITLTGDPFTNRATADFSLNSTAGAGASCRAAGWPGVLGIGGTGYIDIGPLQHQDAGGGSNTYYILNQTRVNYFTAEGE